MTAPSNANTSGLEAENRLKEIAAAVEFGSGNGISFREEGAIILAADIRAVLVTAASAQARIAEEQAERDDVAALREAIFRVILNEGGVMVAPGEEPDAIRRIIARATAAKARADRLADVVRRCVAALDASRSGGEYPDFEEWEKDARTALQQETQS